MKKESTERMTRLQLMQFEKGLKRYAKQLQNDGEHLAATFLLETRRLVLDDIDAAADTGVPQ